MDFKELKANKHIMSFATAHWIGSEEAEASVCPQNRAYGSVHGSSRKTDPLAKLKPMR